MTTVSRFHCPSSPLRTKALLGKASKGLWLSLLIAVACHVSLTRVVAFRAETRSARPLTTQFVKRAPRLTKPLELKKRPQPKPRQVQRAMVSVRARALSEGARDGIHAARVAESLARPRIELGRVVSVEGAGVEPEVLAAAVEGTKDPQQRIDMSLEMVDIEAMDTGQYHAMVVQDPQDKRNVKGFFHIAVVYSLNQESWHGSRYPEGLAVPRLAEAINRYTSIHTDVRGAMPLHSEDIFKVPVVFMTTHYRMQPTNAEAANFGRYLAAGGFGFLEDQNVWLGGSGDMALRQALRDALASQDRLEERDWTFEKLPHAHPLYHCYFDFDGPPVGWDSVEFPGTGRPFPWLDGVTVNGRLLAIMSNKGYMGIWNWAGRGEWHDDPARTFQMGVNIAVFALTQEGSVTHRLMEGMQ